MPQLSLHSKGIFTSILRTILDNQRGEADRRHWIVFDGVLFKLCLLALRITVSDFFSPR